MQFLATGVCFILTDSELILNERSPLHIPLENISKVKVNAHEIRKSYTVTIALGALTAFLVYQGWILTAFVSGILAILAYRHKPSSAVFKAYIWTNGHPKQDTSFPVSSDELPSLKRGFASLPDVEFVVE